MWVCVCVSESVCVCVLLLWSINFIGAIAVIRSRIKVIYVDVDAAHQSWKLTYLSCRDLIEYSPDYSMSRLSALQ